MHIVKIDESRVVKDPFLAERIRCGKRPGTSEFIVVVDGKEAGLLIYEYFPNSHMGFVYEIYVLEGFRERGVGNYLLSQAQETAMGMACRAIRLHARSLDQGFIDDQSLIAWYGRKGFISDENDASSMQKNLEVRPVSFTDTF